ncbi:MAG: sigma-70 family RNA polymerase sigma factor [Cyclobacteriaceae bacterium]|nr:sigma-70 family RNA polymerase sigma factor [Cyclobacteriaceae bacterium HetDA_MAG_MS6]
MKTSDDIVKEWLVVSCQAGDRRSMEMLVKRWHPRIIKQINYQIRDYETSEDIAQEVWIAIIRKIKSLKDPALFGVWSLRIAHHKAVDWIRSHQKDRSRSEDKRAAQVAFTEDDDHPSEEMLGRLRQAISVLPENQRTVISMFYQEKMSIQKIGLVLGIPVGTVKSRLFKAREKLKKTLDSKIVAR